MTKIIALVLCLSMLLTFTSCSSKSKLEVLDNSNSEATGASNTSNAETLNSEIEVADVDTRNLNWYASLEEVKKNEPNEIFNEEVEETEQGQINTLLKYRNIDFMGYETTMVLCLTDGIGLNGINYHVVSQTPDKVYDELSASLTTKYGDADTHEDIYSFWENKKDSNNHSINIMLLNNNSYVQVGYYAASE